MKSIRAKLARIAAAVVASLLIASSAVATPLTVVDYSGNGAPGVSMEITSGGVFQTAGAQTLASFLNWADFLPAVDGAAKVSITGVQLTGSAFGFGGSYTQATTGGSITFSNDTDSNLLTVNFSDGVIILASTGTGGQFTTNVATFSGTLASFFVPSSATHAVSLINWAPVSIVPVNGAQQENFALLDVPTAYRLAASQGYGNGLVGGEPVPEPATMLLLGTGLVGALRARRKAA